MNWRVSRYALEAFQAEVMSQLDKVEANKFITRLTLH